MTDRLSKHLLLALRTCGSLALLTLLAIPIRSCLDQIHGGTNRDYLTNLLKSDTLDQTARAVVSDALAQSPQEKQSIENTRAIVAHCLKEQASAYLASDDAYLSQRADRDTPTVLAMRFLTACGMLK